MTKSHIFNQTTSYTSINWYIGPLY